MNFTVNVQITGLEGIAALLEKLVSVNPSTANTGFVPSQGSITNPTPMAPQVAPAAMVPQVQPQPVQQPMATVPVMQAAPAPAAAVPTMTATYTMDQLAVAATQLVDAGRRAELVSLLASFGVAALTELPKDHYGAFATQLRAMGARI